MSNHPKWIILNVGVSGAGKTTWTKEFIDKNPNFVRINRDSIRESLFCSLKGYYKHSKLKQREDLVTEIEERIANRAVNSGYGIIVDNTNLSEYYIKKAIKFADALGYKVMFKIFNETNPVELKSRVQDRDHLFENELDYIDKQIKDFEKIKVYLQQYKNHFL